MQNNLNFFNIINYWDSLIYLEILFLNNLNFILILIFFLSLRIYFKKFIHLNFRMLFQRLYNWIKYKTLPSSFLFKNRLFIERDSKHKRILSNFGLHYRNSKWSSFSSYNIKYQFVSSYFKLIKFIILIFGFFLIMGHYGNYLINSSSFNNIFFFVWVGVDSFDYSFSFFFWSTIASLSIIIKSVYSYFFFKFFTPTSQFADDKFLSIFKIQLLPNFKLEQCAASKHSLNWIFYSWLTNNNAFKVPQILENLFTKSINLKWWGNYFNFFVELFKITYFLNVISMPANNSMKINKNISPNALNYLQNTNFFTKYFSMFLVYRSKTSENYFSQKNEDSNSLRFLETNYEWNLANIEDELKKDVGLLKSKRGLFYYVNLNYQKFINSLIHFKELLNISVQFKNQTISSKWNRWLYRYSILHRKSVKATHKINASKRLINSGAYDSKFFIKNLWNSEYLSAYSKPTVFTSLYNFFYSNIYQNKKLHKINSYKSLNSNNTNQILNLKLLNSYENSYFWFLKRFLNLNNLSTNFIKSSPQHLNFDSLNKNFEVKNTFLNQYSLFSSYTLKSLNNNLNSIIYFTPYLQQHNEIFKKFHLIDTLNESKIKDVFLLITEIELLTNDNLNIAYWSTTSLNNKNNLFFYNYVTINILDNNIIKFSNCNFQTFVKSNQDLNYWIFFNYSNLNNIFNGDLVDLIDINSN